MIKTCKIVPKFPLPDILKLKRVEYPCTMELNKAEIIRSMNYADVFEILNDGTELLLDPDNFNVDNNLVSVQNSVPDIIGLSINIKANKVNAVGYAGVDLARLY